MVGPWGAILINLALVVSVVGAFLSWTLLAAEIPHAAAKDGTMPKFFGGGERTRRAVISLTVTNLLVQAFLIITLFAQSTYQALFYIASTAILVPYIFSGAYAAKLAITGEGYGAGETAQPGAVPGVLATVYGLWLVYAAGPAYLFMCAILYAPGIVFFVWARRESRPARLPSRRGNPCCQRTGRASAFSPPTQMWTGAVSPL